MTPERRRSNKVLLGAVVTMLIAVLMFMARTTWSTKEDVTDARRMDSTHMTIISAHIVEDHLLRSQDSAWKKEQRDLLYDLFCRQYPASLRCRTVSVP